MVSLVKKHIRGKAYYYARESQRVDGKPTLAEVSRSGRPNRHRHDRQSRRSPGARDFGAVAALSPDALRLADHPARSQTAQRTFRRHLPAGRQPLRRSVMPAPRSGSKTPFSIACIKPPHEPAVLEQPHPSRRHPWNRARHSHGARLRRRPRARPGHQLLHFHRHTSAARWPATARRAARR